MLGVSGGLHDSSTTRMPSLCMSSMNMPGSWSGCSWNMRSTRPLVATSRKRHSGASCLAPPTSLGDVQNSICGRSACSDCWRVQVTRPSGAAVFLISSRLEWSPEYCSLVTLETDSLILSLGLTLQRSEV